MSSFFAAHPDEGALLRYLDGELTAPEARELERHLEACWQCRTAADDLQRTIADCVRYRQQVLETHLPEPPQPWKDLHREFDRIDSEFAARPFLARWRWAALAAAASLMAAAIWYQWRETPAVKAAALLNRAVAAADARPASVRHIRIRTRNREVTRTVGVRPASAPDPDAAPLQAMFEAARYDWDDPLSARAFQRWRASVAEKTDEVTAAPSGDFQIRTAAAEGDLSAATLLLRASDLRPVHERLEFRNRDWVELSEITEPSTPAGGNVAVEAPVRPAEPSRPAAFAPGSSASISDELRVLSALHEIGADLGDPIEVKRSGDQVLVSGIGIPAARQQKIRGALEMLPRVSVNFAEPAPVAAPPESSAVEPSGTPPPGKTQVRIERWLGGRAEFEKFSSRMLDSTDSAMARVYALRALAQRFPVSAERGLATADSGALREIAREHAAALTAQLGAIGGSLEPVLTALDARPGALPSASAADWQSAAENLFRSGRRFEMLLAVAMGVTPAETAASDLPSDLLGSLAQLRADAARCRHLLSQN